METGDPKYHLINLNVVKQPVSRDMKGLGDFYLFLAQYVVTMIYGRVRTFKRKVVTSKYGDHLSWVGPFPWEGRVRHQVVEVYS